MDGAIQAGDVVVSRVNGTFDLYIVATVVSAADDLILRGIRTAKGRDDAIKRGYDQRTDERRVWLFDGSAAAYVKTQMPTAG